MKKDSTVPWEDERCLWPENLEPQIKKASGVYLIRCVVSGKIYIGSTRSILERWRHHRWHLRNGKHGNAHLQAAWDKYGDSAFRFEVLWLCPKEELVVREGQYMALYNALDANHGYNLEVVTAGGYRTHSPETCAKISFGNKGKTVSAEARAKISEASRGRKHSADAVAKMRRSLKGRTKGVPKSAEHKVNLSASLKGRVFTESHRTALSASKKGKRLSPKALLAARGTLSKIHAARVGAPLPEETKAKIAAANRGRVQSPEARAKKSAASKGVPKSPEHVAASVAAKRRNREARLAKKSP
jgi:group I intron endonuclease